MSNTSTLTKKTNPPVGPTHGTLTWLDTPETAANQASLDLAQLSLTMGGVESESARSGGGAMAPALSAAGVSAAAAVAGTLFTGGLFGLGVAGAAKASGQMQLTITNYSSSPVIMNDYQVSNIDIEDVPNPIISGASDTLGLSNSGTSSSFTAIFTIGKSPNTVPFQVQYSYVQKGNPGRWQVSAGVDNSAEYTYPASLQMFGMSFKGSPGYPSFSFYTSSTETTSGALSLAIYDMALK